MADIIWGRLDTSNLVKATQMLQRGSRQLPAEGLARTVAFVVKDAKEITPFVEMAKIDTELSATTTPILSTRGARKGLPLKSGRNTVSVVEGGLATKVILARLHPFSDYNILTDRKYAQDQDSFSPGEGVVGFWKKIEAQAEKMVKSRHSSTHFFQQSWNAVLKALAPLVPATYRAAVMTWAGGRPMAQEIGMASMSGGNSGRAVVTIENRIGMDEAFPTISAIRNMEAHRILEPVLQRSINKNYDKAMKELGRRLFREQLTPMRQLGMTVEP